MIVCWSPKGGSGVSTTAVVMALQSAAAGADTVLVDMADGQGDLSMMLGVTGDEGSPLDEWDGPVQVTEKLKIRSYSSSTVHGDYGKLLDTLNSIEETSGPDTRIIVDAGRDPQNLRAEAEQSLCVIRNCFLGAAKAVRAQDEAPLGGVLVIEEPGRLFRAEHVRSVLFNADHDAVSVVPWDADVAGAVDFARLATNMPRSFDDINLLQLARPEPWRAAEYAKRFSVPWGPSPVPEKAAAKPKPTTAAGRRATRRCKHTGVKSRIQCILAAGHQGSHRYTKHSK